MAFFGNTYYNVMSFTAHQKCHLYTFFLLITSLTLWEYCLMTVADNAMPRLKKYLFKQVVNIAHLLHWSKVILNAKGNPQISWLLYSWMRCTFVHTNISAELTNSIFRLVGLGMASVIIYDLWSKMTPILTELRWEPYIKIKIYISRILDLWHKIPHFIPQWLKHWEIH
jgi:hypothetical protein